MGSRSSSCSSSSSLHVAAALRQRLELWREECGVDEYYDLGYRAPHKEQVVDPVLNRFNGGMGPYAEHLFEDLKRVEYINATPMDHLKGEPYKYIATMCPKMQTILHFWLMAWEKDVRLVVNLSHLKDRVGSGPHDKRENYWPPYRYELDVSDWPVRVETVKNVDKGGGLIEISVRLTLVETQEEREVVILWYQQWVDFPKARSIYNDSFQVNARNVLDVAKLVDEHGKYAPDSWIVVHCSAGVGRTGTLIAILNALHRMQSIRSIGDLDECIKEAIEDMRQRRLWMVKSDSEYATIYNAILIFLEGSRAAIAAEEAAFVQEDDDSAPDNDADVKQYEDL